MARKLLILVAAIWLACQVPGNEAATLRESRGDGGGAEKNFFPATDTHERQKRSDSEKQCDAGNPLKNTVMQMLKSAIEWMAAVLRGGKPGGRRPNNTTPRPVDAEEMEPDSQQVADWE